MDYPEKKDAKTSVIRVKTGLLRGIEKFLDTDRAHQLGFDHNTNVINHAVREFLLSLGILIELEEKQQNTS